MTRTYTLTRRAQTQAQTRQRIVEAVFDLHSSIGPGLTTISMVAQQAGVQRHTVYAHFPDERSLYLACSGLMLERDPLPDAGPWRSIRNRRERLRVGLAEVYSWYERNAGLVARVERDAGYHALTREMSELRFGPSMATYRKVLAAGLGVKQRALVRLALGFSTWQALVHDGGLRQSAAVEAMVGAITLSTLSPRT